MWEALLGRSIQPTIKGYVWQVLSAIVPLFLILFGLLFFHHTTTTVEVRNLIFSGLKNADELTTATIKPKQRFESKNQVKSSESKSDKLTSCMKV